jgi:hypothetical protein
MDINNMGDLLKNAHKVRKQIDSVQQGLKDRFVEGRAGDGLVTVLVNGQQELVKLTIDPQALASNAPDDVELLEDLILAAINQGMEKSRELKNAEVNKVTGGMGDSLSGLLF